MMDHRALALRLLSEVRTLSHKEGGFLGHVVVASDLTEKQANWLGLIAERNGITEEARS